MLKSMFSQFYSILWPSLTSKIRNDLKLVILDSTPEVVGASIKFLSKMSHRSFERILEEIHGERKNIFSSVHIAGFCEIDMDHLRDAKNNLLIQLDTYTGSAIDVEQCKNNIEQYFKEALAQVYLFTLKTAKQIKVEPKEKWDSELRQIMARENCYEDLRHNLLQYEKELEDWASHQPSNRKDVSNIMEFLDFLSMELFDRSLYYALEGSQAIICPPPIFELLGPPAQTLPQTGTTLFIGDQSSYSRSVTYTGAINEQLILAQWFCHYVGRLFPNTCARHLDTQAMLQFSNSNRVHQDYTAIEVPKERARLT